VHNLHILFNLVDEYRSSSIDGERNVLRLGYMPLFIQVSQVVLVSDFFLDFLSDVEGCKPDP